MPDPSTITEAKKWCNEAREVLLGYKRGFIRGSSSHAMYYRLEEVETQLKSLKQIADVNPSLQPKYEEHLGYFKNLARQAKELKEDTELDGTDKETRMVTVSGYLSLLSKKIQVTIGENKRVDVTDVKRQVGEETAVLAKQTFEQRVEDFDRRLSDFQDAATPEEYDRFKEAIEQLEQSTEEAETYEAGVGRLNTLFEELKQALEERQAKAEQWDNAADRLRAAQELVDDILETGVFAGERNEAVKSLALAEKAADEAHNFDEALQHLQDAEDVLAKVVQMNSEIERKIADFKGRQAKLDTLLNQSRQLLDRLVSAFKSNANGASATMPPEQANAAMGKLGQAYEKCQKIVEGRKRAIDTLEGWAPYPTILNTAEQELKAVKGNLDRELSGKNPKQQGELLTRKARDLIQNYNREANLNALIAQQAKAKGETNTALQTLAAAVGTLDADYQRFTTRFGEAVEAFKKRPAPTGVTALTDLKREVATLLQAKGDEKNTLTDKAERLEGEWNKALTLTSKIRTFLGSEDKYLEGLKEDWAVTKKMYVDGAESLATLQAGVDRMGPLVTRLQEFMKDGSKVKGCLRTFEGLGEEVNNGSKNALLKDNLPTAFAELKQQYDELEKSGDVGKEDPTTLERKLAALRDAINDAKRTAQEVADARRAVTELYEELVPLFERAEEKMDLLLRAVSGGLPPGYETSFAAQAKGHHDVALALEAPDKINERKTLLAQMKTKLEEFQNFSPTQVQTHFDTVESGHIKGEQAKEDQRNADRLLYEGALRVFTSTTYPEAAKKAGQKFYSSLPGFTDRMKTVKAKRKEAEQLARDEDYRGALSALNIASLLARDLGNSPDGSAPAKSLTGLDEAWKTHATKFKADLEALAGKVVTDCEAVNRPGSAEAKAKIEKACRDLANIIDVEEFKKLVGPIVAETASKPRAQAEKALQVVRQRLKFIQSPLVMKMVGNEFGVPVGTAMLYRTLRSLETNLQTVS